MHSKAIKQLVLEKHRSGKSYRKISEELGIAFTTIASMCQSVDKRRKTAGRKPVLTPRDQRRIRRDVQTLVNRDEKVTSKKILSRTQVPVSKRTMQRHLKRLGYQYKLIRKRIRLTEQQKKARVEQCKEWLQARTDFKKVVMSDEKKFRLDGPDNLMSYQPANGYRQKRSKRQQGGGGVMAHVTALPDGSFRLFYIDVRINAAAYKEMLDKEILPFIRRSMGNDFILQHDGAKPHTSCLVSHYLQEQRISVLKWPAKSPDLNIVEKIWAWIVDEVYSEGDINNIAQLKGAINAAVKKVQRTKRASIVEAFASFSAKAIAVVEKKGELLS